MSTKKSVFDLPILHKFLGTDPNKKDEMQPKEALGYSFAGFGQNIICQLVTTFFMVYLTDVAMIPPMWLAFMFLGARLFDAFNDPIMGSIVDRTKTKWGKMRPYLLYAPIPIGIFTVLLFTTFSTNIKVQFVISTIIYLCWGISYTIVDVPYWGLSSAMTKDGDQRNTLLTVARLICTIGSGVVSIIIPAVTDAVDPSAYKTAYLIIAIVSVLVALPTFFVGFKSTTERYYDEEANKTSLGKSLKLLFKNKPLLLLILVGVLGGLRTIYMTTTIYYANYNLMNLSLAGVIFLLVVPGGLAATLLTPVLSKKFGKKNVFIWSHIIGGLLLVLLYFIGKGSNGTSQVSQVFFYIIIIIAGVPSGFSNILTYAMIADSIDYLEDKTGERAEGICFAMQTFISKIGMALTAFVTLMVLGEFGYDQSFLEAFQSGIRVGAFSMGDGGVIQVVDGASKVIDGELITFNMSELGMDVSTFQGMYSKVCEGTWLATTLLCGASMFACIIPLFFYKFDEKAQAEAVARVAARKAAIAEVEVIEEVTADGDIVEVVEEVVEVDETADEEVVSETEAQDDKDKQ
ncbi:MAG: glycoside-pentoside-hexuronide (GPH):cation symporter [Eubacteriales bacterium]|nr:glycoside-pentoside-hexuronide (GPH):cation symporter [Eubacteriales bacterium]